MKFKRATALDLHGKPIITEVFCDGHHIRKLNDAGRLHGNVGLVFVVAHL